MGTYNINEKKIYYDLSIILTQRNLSNNIHLFDSKD